MNARPTTLAQVAADSANLEDFGRNLRDWLHEVRRCSSRKQISAAIETAPRFLADVFPQGSVADAWLGAYAELAAVRARVSIPAWADTPGRTVPQPWFADTTGSAQLRWLALRDTPLPFKRRNLYLATPEAELPLRLRRGRPAKPLAALRQNNAERQRRFRQRRATELAALRKELKQLRRKVGATSR